MVQGRNVQMQGGIVQALVGSEGLITGKLKVQRGLEQGEGERGEGMMTHR